MVRGFFSFLLKLTLRTDQTTAALIDSKTIQPRARAIGRFFCESSSGQQFHMAECASTGPPEGSKIKENVELKNKAKGGNTLSNRAMKRVRSENYIHLTCS